MALSKLTKVQTLGIGSNIEVVGVITTGQFKSGTSNLHSTGVELTNLNVSGIATIGGNISIGGTLTYEDVTNVDSLGIGTFRSGINVSGGQLDVGSNIKIGNAGVITATSFSGDGSNLTGLASDKIEEGNSSIEVIDTGTGKIDLKVDGSNTARFQKVTGNRTYMLVGNPLAVANDYGTNSGHLIVVANNGSEPATLRLFGWGPGVSDGTVNNRIDFATHQSGSGGQTFAKIETEVRGTGDNSSDMTFHTANTGSGTPAVSEKVRITKDGHLNAGGTVLSTSDLNWSHDTYQRPHIFSGITGGNPSDGTIALASPETNPSNTRIGAVVFGCKTSSTSGVSNSGVKASIEGWTHTNVSDAWKTGSYIRFQTRPDNGNLSEKLRITSDGNIVFGVQGSDTPITNAHIRHIEGGQDYWNGTKGDYRSLRYLTFYGGIDNAYGMGVSSSELELQSQQDLGIYAGGSGSNTGRRNLRILLDNSENTLKFQSNTKTAFRGSVYDPQHHAFINMGSNNNTGETRAIDVWGSWGTGENKSITFNHGSTVNQMVAQINAIHYGGTPSRTTPHSSLRWGKLYHTTDSTTYTMTLDSTGTTSADLNLKGAYRSTRHPAFSAGSSGNNNNLGSLTKLNYTISGTGAANNDGYDTTNNRFVAPVDGFYHFYTRHWFTTGQTGTAWLYFYRNGAQVKECRLNITSTTSEYNTMQLSTTLYLSASNYIEVYAQGSGSSQFHPSNNTFHTEFSGFLVC